MASRSSRGDRYLYRISCPVLLMIVKPCSRFTLQDDMSRTERLGRRSTDKRELALGHAEEAQPRCFHDDVILEADSDFAALRFDVSVDHRLDGEHLPRFDLGVNQRAVPFRPVRAKSLCTVPHLAPWRFTNRSPPSSALTQDDAPPN